MKKRLNFLLLIIVVAGLSNCAPSDTVVQTAIEKTLEANPTSTIQPTNTPEPTAIIPPTSTSKPSATPTTTPAFEIGSTMISEKDGMVMVYVPDGEFFMGSENGEDDEKPVHIVYLDAFWIDQTEVTNAMYETCVEAGVCNPPRSKGSYTRVSYYGNSEFDNYPVIHVSWNDAKVYCEWADRRLPTEAEWEKAARWNEDSQTQRLYPWGDTIDESYANYNHNIGDTTAVGSYEKGISFYGAYDMAGNVSEWLTDWINVYPGGDKNASSYFGQTYRLLRGGSFQVGDFSVRSAGRGSNNPMRTDNDFGFRCTRNAIPTEIIAPTSSTVPEGQLYYDDFEGEEKTYISLEDDPTLVSKGITTIDDNHVYFVNTQTQTTLLFSELLDTTEPLEDYAVQFDMMLSNQPKPQDNSRWPENSWFSVDLRSNRRNNEIMYEYYAFQWYFFVSKARDGSLRNSQINLWFYVSNQEPIGIKQQDNYFFYENFWYHIRVEVKGNEFKWYFIDSNNENLFFRYVDEYNRSPSGWPSFSIGPDTGVTFYFDNILVEALE